MYNVLTLNKIAAVGTKRLGDNYTCGDEVQNPDAVLVRSAAMHDMTFGDNLLAIARAGAGTNNIPVDKCAEQGIVVFNTPGANANGVKELAVAALLLASRDIVGGIEWANSISDDPDIANAYDPVIAGAIKELSATIGNTSIKNMSIEQLSDVYDVYRAVLTRVRDANKAMAENIKASIEELAKSTIREVQTVGGSQKYRISALDAVRKFDWNNMKPVYAMERIGSSTLTEVFNNVRAGEDTWAKDVSEAREYYLEKSKKYGYDKWDFDKKYRFESNSGIPFELTLEQILSLYAYSRRKQAHEHLRLGGFVFDSNIETMHGAPGFIQSYFNA